MCVFGVGFNSYYQKAKQQTSMGIPLEPVERCISLVWSIHSQGSVAQCLCFLSQRAFYLQLYSLSTCSSVVKSHQVFLHFLLWQYFLILAGMTTTIGRVTLLPSFANILVTQWTKWHPYSSLIDCSTCSQLIALCHKSDSLNTWRHAYRYYWSLCARVLVKHLMLMEVGPEGAQLWILSLFPPWWPPGKLFLFSFLSLLLLSLPKSYFDCPYMPPGMEPADKSLCM